MASPVEWVAAIEEVAKTFITSQDGFKVGQVLYHPGAAVRPDECCNGVLCIDATTWMATGEPWPSPRQPSGPQTPCAGAGVLNVDVKYMTCVTAALTDTGRRPPADVQKTEQSTLLDLGFRLWLVFLHEEKTWAKTLGLARVGAAHRVPNGPQ